MIKAWISKWTMKLANGLFDPFDNPKPSAPAPLTEAELKAVAGGAFHGDGQL
jgi:hypothetical protein